MESPEEDPSLELSLPWLRPVATLVQSYSTICTHQVTAVLCDTLTRLQGFCLPACTRRNARAARKLMGTVRRLYGERVEYIEDLFLPSEEGEGSETLKKGRWGKWSESASTSPEHRKGRDGEERESEEGEELGEGEELPAFLRYLQLKVRGLFHAPQSTLNKAACIVDEGVLSSTVNTNWNLLLDQDPDVAGASSASVIVASVKEPRHTMGLVMAELRHPAAHVRINAILRVQVLWKNRYQVWSRLEDGGQISMKVTPSQIEFTLPSPKIGEWWMHPVIA